MKVDDRSAIAEHLIYQLWEKNYFASIPLKTIDGLHVDIISNGIRNNDAGPDFKEIVIKLDDKIYHGDLEIHRAPEDWYQHSHHADPAYNNVVMHLVIGPEKMDEPAIKLNRQPVVAHVFVDIPDEKFLYLAKRYRLSTTKETLEHSICDLNEKEDSYKLAIIEHYSRQRLQAKADRFSEQRQTSSWNQIFYVGIMEALGYSKNQIPFRKLAQLFPFEALMRELQDISKDETLIVPLGLLLGIAGLLPSQDPSFDWRKIKDQETHDYVPQLEKVWRSFSDRLGLNSMSKEEWQFFRLRPSNFPTRRLAGASLILPQFVKEGILENILKILVGLKNNNKLLIKELENRFICKTGGYWATHYLLEEKPPDLYDTQSATLIGRERSRDIVINVILPGILAYASEIENAQLKNKILQIYQEYPKLSSNSIITKMTESLFGRSTKAKKLVNTAAKQQGLIHLYKLYCHRGECEKCREEREQL